MEERVIEDPVLAQRYIFRRAVAQDGREVLQVEAWVDPGGGVLIPHIHPRMEERFEVLSGDVRFLVGRKRVRASTGDQAVVAPGVRHGYRNTGNVQAHIMCEASPPDAELQQFLEDAAGLGRAGKFTKRGIPTSFSGLLQGAILIDHYREMVVFLSPPRFLQRLFVGPLARLGERRGYRAGKFAEDILA
jgi:quercetin dioxygenase-like cupin family protein